MGGQGMYSQQPIERGNQLITMSLPQTPPPLGLFKRQSISLAALQTGTNFKSNIWYKDLFQYFFAPFVRFDYLLNKVICFKIVYFDN